MNVVRRGAAMIRKRARAHEDQKSKIKRSGTHHYEGKYLLVTIIDIQKSQKVASNCALWLLFVDKIKLLAPSLEIF